MGVLVGASWQYEVSVLAQHVSNGGIHDPNNGLTFFSLGFAYHFGARP